MKTETITLWGFVILISLLMLMFFSQKNFNKFGNKLEKLKEKIPEKSNAIDSASNKLGSLKERLNKLMFRVAIAAIIVGIIHIFS